MAASRYLAAASAAAMVSAARLTRGHSLRLHPQPRREQTIDCGAGVGDRNTCDADTSSGVVLVRQTGEGNCVLGRTWGFDAKGVWVADGCRGTFAFTDDRATVTCSAAAGAREVCKCEHRRRRGARQRLARMHAGSDLGLRRGWHLGVGRLPGDVRPHHPRRSGMRVGWRASALRRRHVRRSRARALDRHGPVCAGRVLGL